MIFYFSGTGNSRFAAKFIGDFQGDKVISIAKEFDKKNNSFEYKIEKGEILGFVFPVYAWGTPKIVLDFINKIKVIGEISFAFSLCTCGDEEGKTTKNFKRVLAKKGIELDSAFTLIMPNNYIIGFDVDSEELIKKKISNAKLKLTEINNLIEKREKGIFDLYEGSLPRIKSSIVNPLFNKHGMSTKKFFATEACTSCGICESVCPIHTIKLEEKPQWGERCTQCLACINSCPTRAIQYGKGTLKKGRYICSEI